MFISLLRNILVLWVWLLAHRHVCVVCHQTVYLYNNHAWMFALFVYVIATRKFWTSNRCGNCSKPWRWFHDYISIVELSDLMLSSIVSFSTAMTTLLEWQWQRMNLSVWSNSYAVITCITFLKIFAQHNQRTWHYIRRWVGICIWTEPRSK